MKANQGKHLDDKHTESASRRLGGSLSAKALEYYRMYAGNDELPKYFSGDYDLNALEEGPSSLSTPTATTSSLLTVRSVSKQKVDEMGGTDAETNPRETVVPDIPDFPEIPEIPEYAQTSDDVQCASPTSSNLSTKKQLEWDSGADIGYTALHKSISMPTLDEGRGNRGRKSKKLHGRSLATVLASDSDNTDVSNVDLCGERQKKRHQDIMSFLKLKVGLPAAESTPVSLEVQKSGSDPALYPQTPHNPSLKTLQTKKLSKLNTTTFNYELAPSSDCNVVPSQENVAFVEIQSESQTKTNLGGEITQKTETAQKVQTTQKTNTQNISLNDTLLPNKIEYFARYRRGKLQNLQIAQPISIECLSTVPKEDCETQTTQHEDFQRPHTPSHASNHGNNDASTSKTLQNSESRHSIGVQTSRRSSKQEILYLFHPGETAMRFDKSSSSSGTMATSSCNSGQLGRLDDRAFSNCNSFEYVAGSQEEVEEEQSKAGGSWEVKQDGGQSSVSLHTAAGGDLTSTTTISSRNSPKSSCTSSTKEVSVEEQVDLEKSLRNMKKVIRSRKYGDKFKQVYIRKMAQRIISQATSANLTSAVLDSQGNTIDVQSLGQNDQTSSKSSKSYQVPARHHPAPSKIAKTPKVQPPSNLVSTQSSSTPPFTRKSRESSVPTKSISSSTKQMVSENEGVSLDQNVPDWKQSVTNSEKLYSSLETKSSTDSPKECLVSFAKRERENQLDWITNEIEHLAKLKSLLETKKQKEIKTKTISSSVPNVAVQENGKDYKDYKKSTAVYMITTEKLPDGFCAANCASKTTQNAVGEIDFHVHNTLGIRDYKFKEIITKITPRDEEQPDYVEIPQGSVKGSQSSSNSNLKNPKSAKTAQVGATCLQPPSCSHHPNTDSNNLDNVSDRIPQCPYNCRPCHNHEFGAAGCAPCAPGGTAGDALAQSLPIRRQRDIFPTPPVDTKNKRPMRSRSRTPSSSITDDTSGYPSRRRYQVVTPKKVHRKPTKRRESNIIESPKEYCDGGDVRKLTVSTKKSDSDTESSYYESLSKYQSKTKTSNVSRMLTVEDQKRVKEVPHAMQHFAAVASGNVASGPTVAGATAAASGPGCFCREYYPPGASTLPSLSNLPLGSPKKDSYKQYKAQKLKEKEQVKKKKTPEKEKEKPKTLYRAREKSQSDAEPKSISDEESRKYLKFSDYNRNVRKALDEPVTLEYKPQPLPLPTNSGSNKHSKTDTESDKKRQLKISSKNKPPGSKTDSEVHSFERFTNTEGPWHEDDDDEEDYIQCQQPVQSTPCACAKAPRNLCSCVPPVPSDKEQPAPVPTKPPPVLVEKGVMKDEEPKTTDAKDVQVGEKPIMKQMAVGDDVNRTAKETASQIPHTKTHTNSGALSISRPAVVTYMPSSGDNLRPYKMVKDLSKINLSSAVIISSMVTSSVSNPEDNCRRLVLEMPLDDRDQEATPRNLRRDDTATIREVDENETEMQDSEVFSSLACSCLPSSSAMYSAESVAEVMCSCCGKCVVSSESSLVLGDNNAQGNVPFCWPCYHASTKREWNPSDPFFQQPDHMCKCYNKIDDNALEKIRDTLRQLAEIDSQEQEPAQPTKLSKAERDRERLVCHSCNKKIKRESPVKKPVAYVLKFEPGEEADEDDEKPDMQSLQEIRVKLPTAKNKKGSTGGGNSVSTKKKRKSMERPSEKAGDMDIGGKRDGGSRNLQDYLSSNRPDFVRSAEERRRCLIELAYMREQRARKYQELLALSNEISAQNNQLPEKKHLFTTKEMKAMTAKNYKKLPEVREKILRGKKERIRQTNRLLVSIFNQKLRETVLRGQASLSTSISVINM